MEGRSWIPRFVASLVATVVLLALGWALVYYFAVEPLASRGAEAFGKVFSNINLGSTSWWRDFISLAFDLLIVVVAVLGSWWVLGHLALEAGEAGKWRRYYASSEAARSFWVDRLSLWQRVQHLWLLVTFIVCAVTGLAAHFDVLASRPVLIEVHVYSGVAMGVLVVLHFAQYTVEAILVKAGGGSLRKRYPMLEIYSFRFLRSFVKALLRPLSSRIRAEPYGKYDPEQLFEYWGVYWGIAVLGIPGILIAIYGPDVLDGVLWVMHFKEAVLAISFILMVHIAYTHFRPTVFPMDPTFIHGKMPLKRVREEHPLWAEQLAASGILPGEGVEKPGTPGS